VSLYNETDGKAVLPTPVIGVVGLLDDASTVLARVFPEDGLDVVLLGENFGEMGGSEYLKSIMGQVAGVPPALNLDAERALQQLMVALAAERLVRSAHDCADGGLAVALAECCFDSGGRGVRVSVPPATDHAGFPSDVATLFGESASRIILSVDPSRTADVVTRAGAAGVPVAVIGVTGGAHLQIAIDGREVVDCAVSEAEARWANGLSQWMER
jgi:phosphoribosylformylglycinamidine synthase